MGEEIEEKKRRRLRKEDRQHGLIHTQLYRDISELMEKHQNKLTSKPFILHEDGLGYWGGEGKEQGIFQIIREHSDKIKRVYLSDINPGPLKKAERTIEKMSEEQREKIRLQEEPSTRRYFSPRERADIAISAWVVHMFDKKDAREYLRKIVDGLKPEGFLFVDRYSARNGSHLGERDLMEKNLKRIDETENVLLYQKRKREKKEKKV